MNEADDYIDRSARELHRMGVVTIALEDKFSTRAEFVQRAFENRYLQLFNEKPHIISTNQEEGSLLFTYIKPSQGR